MQLDEFGSFVRGRRTERGETLAGFAKKINVQAGHLSAIETGYKPASLDLFARIRNGLELPECEKAHFSRLYFRSKTQVLIRTNGVPVELLNKLHDVVAEIEATRV